MSANNCGECPDCKTRLLPRMSTGHGKTFDRDESWCPKCHRDWIARPREPDLSNVVLYPWRSAPPQSAPVASIADDPTGIAYQLRLQPDGMISLRIGKLGPWLLSEEQARDFEHSLCAMANDSRDRRTHLRGADRWAFRREGETVYARIYDEEATLAEYTVGTQRRGLHQAQPPGFTCDRCKVRFVKGTRAYKAAKWDSSGWRVQWSTVRFCGACVAGTIEARVAKGLRVLDGGKGRTA